MAETSDSTELRFEASRSAGHVSAILRRPAEARTLLVLGHGAGAGMRHAFMEGLADALAGEAVATFRYQFPYVEQHRPRPDPQPILLATVRSAVVAAREAAGDLPSFAGGKSMGGRMTTLAAAKVPLVGVAGLVLVGFPLHPAKQPATSRAEHLAAVSHPMLFLQGTRDTLADLDLLRPTCERLGHRASLVVVEGADHGFHVLKRSGRNDADVLHQLATVTAQWMTEIAGRRSTS